MIFGWLLMMASMFDMQMKDYNACKKDNFKPKVCEKFNPKPVEKKWW